jgi:hypothetical protein
VAKGKNKLEKDMKKNGLLIIIIIINIMNKNNKNKENYLEDDEEVLR